MLIEIVKNAIGHRPEAAKCTGCHYGKPYHVMACEELEGIHVYVPERQTTGVEAFEQIAKEVATLDLPHKRWRDPGERRLHLVFQMGG